MDDDLNYCLSMLAENDLKTRQDALRILLKICDNIIKFPEVAKYRKIQVASSTVVDKLLVASGAVECLFEIGFVEDGEYFSMPSNASVSKVIKIENLLRELWNREDKFTPIKTATPSTSAEHEVLSLLPRPSFFQKITDFFHSVLKYEDKKIQQNTKRLIPITQLQLGAIKNFRAIQKKIKFQNYTDNDEVSIDDLVLIELLHWFKNDFFTWVDSPVCRLCSKPCKFDRNEYTSDTRISRIEIHKCMICGGEEKFIRYTDPEILLTTRKGRCGEWANVFTLICRTLGYDARIVHDKTDHVWTEVWSVTAQRWIHADPCEDVIDRPLLYEKGWKKKLSYIIAYSKDEVQDVTWRYTRDQVEVMKRRNICSEESLLALIQRLNDERRNSPGYSNARKRFVVKRQLMELAEFLQTPADFKKSSETDDDNQYGGRISGDASWRMARGELSETDKLHMSHVWKVPNDINTFQLRYFIVKDIYDVHDEHGKILEVKNNWKDGVDTYNGEIFRNVENDWMMVYLARSRGTAVGAITWSIEVSDNTTKIDSFELRAASTTFNDATVEWLAKSINYDDTSTLFSIHDYKLFKISDLKNTRKISVIAKLSGGSGDVSWQHAQLFRHSINCTEECPFMITVTVKKITE